MELRLELRLGLRLGIGLGIGLGPGRGLGLWRPFVFRIPPTVLISCKSAFGGVRNHIVFSSKQQTQNHFCISDPWRRGSEIHTIIN